MTFTSLASSSRGNAYVVSDGETTLLLECGLTVKELQKRLGFQLSTITACFVSHEHQDHAKAAAQLLKRGIPVYMSYGTASILKEDMDMATLIRAGEEIQIGWLRVKPFQTFHNAQEPLGFVIWDVRTDERMLFAVDTMNMNIVVEGLTHICIECNYQDELLAVSERAPTLLKERIRKSHLEADMLLKYLKRLDLSQVSRIWLLHLSSAHTHEYRLLEQFARELPGTAIEICKE